MSKEGKGDALTENNKHASRPDKNEASKEEQEEEASKRARQ